MASSEGRKIWTYEDIYSLDEDYGRGRFALDSGYLGFSNDYIPEGERIAPQRKGSGFDVYTGTLGTTQVTAKSLVYGMRYLFIEEGAFLDSYRLYTVAGNNYTLFSVVSGSTQPEEIIDFEATTTGWQNVTLTSRIVPKGSSFDLLVLVQEPDPTPTVTVINRNYTTPPNDGIPAANTILQANESLGVWNIDKAANAPFLEGIVTGDIIEGAGKRWSVQFSADNGTYMTYAVAPAQQGSPDGVQDFSFETVTPTPITYGIEGGVWAGSATVRGLISPTGSLTDVAETDDQYGIDINITRGSVSEKWNIAAYSSLLGGTAESSVLSPLEVNWVKASTTNITFAEVETTDSNWTEIARYLVPANSGVKVKASVEGKRTDDLGFFSGEYALLVYRNGTTELVQGVSTIFRKTTQNGLNFRAFTSGNDLILEVRGRNNQDWEWDMDVFFKLLD